MNALKRLSRALEPPIRARSLSAQCRPAFQYMSDLHLEVGQQYQTFNFNVTAPNLILAGDIGRLIDYQGYTSFLQKQIARYERVFLVLGNHEFYGLSFEDGLARARLLEREPVLEGKVVLLQQDSFALDDDTIVVGCCLWSFIPEDSAPATAAVVNDFKQIEGWTIEKHNSAHSEDLAWLRQEVQRCKTDAKILVVTHHAPLIGKTASPQHKNSPVKSAFATDLLSNTRADSWSQVKYWVFGHTHWTTQFKVKGTRVVSNQRGYVFPGNNVRLRVEAQAPKHTFRANRRFQF